MPIPERIQTSALKKALDETKTNLGEGWKHEEEDKNCTTGGVVS